MNYNCSIFWDLRNLQEQVKKAFCYQKLFWPFTVLINCSSDLKNFENSRLSALNFKSFSRSLQQFFLTVGQNNFVKKIPNLAGIQIAMLPSDVLNSFSREGRKLIFILSFPSNELKDKLFQGENFSIQILHVCLVWILNDNCRDALMALWFECIFWLWRISKLQEF